MNIFGSGTAKSGSSFSISAVTSLIGDNSAAIITVDIVAGNAERASAIVKCRNTGRVIAVDIAGRDNSQVFAAVITLVDSDGATEYATDIVGSNA